MSTDDQAPIDLNDASTRRRLIDEEMRRSTEIFVESGGMAHDPGRQIPPPVDPNAIGTVASLLEGYKCLNTNIEDFRAKVVELAHDARLNPAEQVSLLTLCTAFQDAVFTAAQITGRWDPNGPDADQITPEVHRIADHAKYMYAIGSRDVVARNRSWRCWPIPARSTSRRTTSCSTTCATRWVKRCPSTRHPCTTRTPGMGRLELDDNTYSDGRAVVIQARITGWSELEGSWPRNEGVEVSGDGPINDFPLGSVCHINLPDDPDPQLEPRGRLDRDRPRRAQREDHHVHRRGRAMSKD